VIRQANEDYPYGNMTIPKGTMVMICTNLLHHDPELWDEPETFRPERFSPENKASIRPGAYQAFGDGPRNCIGMRFALLEAKLALAKILLKYKLVPGSRTEIGDIDVDYKFLTMTPKNGVFAKVVPV